MRVSSKWVGLRLVRAAAAVVRERGIHWLHIDYEPHLETFYRDCGFKPTLAGLMELKEA
jgi:GNAT superfamily N-acetyltransferase